MVVLPEGLYCISYGVIDTELFVLGCGAFDTWMQFVDTVYGVTDTQKCFVDVGYGSLIHTWMEFVHVGYMSLTLGWNLVILVRELLTYDGWNLSVM